MYKFIIMLLALLFSACSTHVTVNEQMCDKIAKDPRETIPQECIPYIEAEAAEASMPKKDKKSSKDSIEFTK